MSDKIITQEDLGILYPQEVELITLLREKYRYGEVSIEVRDGLPIFIVQTIKREKLG